MRAFFYLRSSLSGRLLFSLIIPVIIGVSLICYSGARAINRIVEHSDDQVLQAVGRATADTLAYKDGKVTLNIPTTAFSLLDTGDSNLYYSIRMGRNFISGNRDLPVIPIGAGDRDDTRLVYASHHGHRIRIVAIGRHVTGAPEMVVVEVAQTLNRRITLRWWLIKSLLFNGLLTIGVLILLLPFNVRWSLAPLAEVEREIDNRRADDFKPLMLRNVPIETRSILTAFNGLLLRLHRAMEEIRRFTSDASHQMRTPLSILRTHLDVIRREGLDSAKGQASFADVETAVSRLQRLLTQLLALARAEDAREEVAGFFERTDLVAMARNVAESNVPVALAAGVELEFDAHKAVIHVDTVETLAQELIANLLDNAVRYNRKGGSVRVTLDQSDQIGWVVIEDDGPGIPAEELDRMFDRFRRLARDQKQEGSGLGLAIVKSIADSIGATVTITQGTNGTGLRAEVRFATARPPV